MGGNGYGRKMTKGKNFMGGNGKNSMGGMVIGGGNDQTPGYDHHVSCLTSLSLHCQGPVLSLRLTLELGLSF